MSTERYDIEDLIRDRLEEFDVEYNPSHWDEMEARLDQVPAPPSSPDSPGLGVAAKVFTGLTVAAIAVAVIGFFGPEDSNEVAKDEPVITEVDETPVVQEDQITEDGEGAVDAKTMEITDEPNEDVVTAAKGGSGGSEGVIMEKDPNDTNKSEVLEDQITKYSDRAPEMVKAEQQGLIEEELVKDIAAADEHPVALDNSALKTRFSANKTLICVGEKVEFLTSRNIKGAEYFWDFGDDGLTSRRQNPSHVFKRPGTFAVSLMVSKGEKDTYMEVMEDYIVVREVPEVEMNYYADEVSLEDPYVKFEVNAKDKDQVTWSYHDQTRAEGHQTKRIYELSGSYGVKVTVENNAGCKTTAHNEIYVPKGSNMIVENSFTPNNDGNNDEFIPRELIYANVPFRLSIFQADGKKVFETYDGSKAWNGRMFNTGEQLPRGNYVYKVVTTDKYGTEHFQQGQFLLLR